MHNLRCQIIDKNGHQCERGAFYKLDYSACIREGQNKKLKYVVIYVCKTHSAMLNDKYKTKLKAEDVIATLYVG